MLAISQLCPFYCTSGFSYKCACFCSIFEIRYCNASSFVLLAQNCFSYSVFVVPYKVYECFFLSMNCGSLVFWKGLHEICILKWNGHFNCINSSITRYKMFFHFGAIFTFCHQCFVIFIVEIIDFYIPGILFLYLLWMVLLSSPATFLFVYKKLLISINWFTSFHLTEFIYYLWHFSMHSSLYT